MIIPMTPQHIPATDGQIHDLEQLEYQTGYLGNSVLIVLLFGGGEEAERLVTRVAHLGRQVLRRRRWLGLDPNPDCGIYTPERLLTREEPGVRAETRPPTPTPLSVIAAIEQFLAFGEGAYCAEEHHPLDTRCLGHHGVFSRGGWPAVVLRQHLQTLKQSAGQAAPSVFRVTTAPSIGCDNREEA